MDKKLTIINIVLVLLAIFLGYLVYSSISQPIVFDNTKRAREEKVVQNLKVIRDAENLFKGHYDKYTANFDSLIEFIKVGELPVINRIQDPNDTTFTKTIDSIVGYVKVMDSLQALSKDEMNVNIETLRYIPFTEPQQEFDIQAGYITRGGMNVPVFEVKAHYSTYLNDLDQQRVRNEVAQREDLNKYPGIKVGSMSEPSTDGNWENL